MTTLFAALHRQSLARSVTWCSATSSLGAVRTLLIRALCTEQGKPVGVRFIGQDWLRDRLQPIRVEDHGESECRPVMGRIGDATIAPPRKRADFHVVAYREIGLYRDPERRWSAVPSGAVRPSLTGQGGCSSMAEQRLPKPTTRVRFPSPAPLNWRLIRMQCGSTVMSPPRRGRAGTRFRGPALTKSFRGYRHVLRKQQSQASGGKCAPCRDF